MPIRVALLETAPPDAPGSMLRLACMLERAFAKHTDIRVTRVPLAPSEQFLKRFPAKLRSWTHHLLITASAWWLNKRDFDVFHLLDGSHGYVIDRLPADRTIATAHDIIPWLQWQGRFKVPAPGRGAQWLIKRSLQGLAKARLILSDSDSTLRDLRSTGLVNNDIELCPLALEPEFLAPHPDPVHKAGEYPVVFHIGNNGFYKNREGVIDVFALIREKVPAKLILAGPPPSGKLKDRVAQLPCRDDINFLIDPSDQALHSLYRQASVFLFPSYYEGFGWPPLEAMANGCPVVASTAGSLPEVTGSAAFTASAEDIEQLANHCLTILQDKSEVSRLRQAGHEQAAKFSVDRLRDQLAAAYLRVATGGKS